MVRFNTLADGGLRLTFDSGEPTPETGRILASVNKKTGVLVFKADVQSLTEGELEQIKGFETSGMVKIDPRSKSQKLRAVLFHHFTKLKEMGAEEVAQFEKFEEFYNHTLNRIINYYGQGLEK